MGGQFYSNSICEKNSNHLSNKYCCVVFRKLQDKSSMMSLLDTDTTEKATMILNSVDQWHLKSVLFS